MDKITFNFKNRTAVITGGAQGFGFDIAKRFLNSGAKVIIWDNDPDTLKDSVKELNNTNLTSNVVDVSKFKEVENCTNEIIKKSKIDILINNAGQSAAKPFEDVDDELWDYDLDLKLKAAIRCSRLAVPALRKSAHGRIINVTAVAGKAPRAGSLPTSVSRAAGIALTKAMSLDLAKYGILVNTICILSLIHI